MYKTRIIFSFLLFVATGTCIPQNQYPLNGPTVVDDKIGFKSGLSDGRVRGIWLWRSADSNHVIYSSASTGISPAGNNAVDGLWDSGHRLRLRTSSNQGFLFENKDEIALVDIDADNGNMRSIGIAYFQGTGANYFSGNIGIGTTTPNEKLEVIGKIRADYLRVDSENPTSVEGGEIMLDGANGFNDWRIDNFQGKFRLHHSGTNQFTVHSNGQVGIGTGNSSLGTHKLAVEGTIGAREIKVEASGWSDFVFYDNYKLPTLEEVEKHISEKGHLPEIPSEVEVAENGINLGEMDAKLLQKIEELTLYIIEQNKQNQSQQARIEQLEKELKALKNK